ncbi:MAG: helix-hairpin-helix domain-containing protein [Rhodoferax sp.]|nr:helix-hairpin-helix domain-containing protein [Rhodoferax sp.]
MLKKILAIVAMLYAAAAFAAVDVNKATAAELDGIKGIGPGISAKILDERKKGNFKDWNDFIERVKGIGEANAAKFSAEGVTVGGASYKGAPAAPAAKVEMAKPAAAAATAAPAAAPAAAKADPKAEAKMKAEEEKKAKAAAKAKAAEEKKAKKEADMKAKEEAKAKKAEKPAAKADAAKPAASAAKK